MRSRKLYKICICLVILGHPNDSKQSDEFQARASSADANLLALYFFENL